MKKLLATILLSVIILSGCSAIKQPANPTSTPYPDEVPWEVAVEIINSSEVETIFQLHNLQVTLSLADGSEIKTIEPFIDAVFQEVDKCGQPCSNIMMATE